MVTRAPAPIRRAAGSEPMKPVSPVSRMELRGECPGKVSVDLQHPVHRPLGFQADFFRDIHDISVLEE